MRHHQSAGTRRWPGIVAGASLVLAGLGTPAVAADAAPDPGQPEPSKIREQVSDELQAKGSTDFWVRFADRPDLSQYTRIADWDKRGEAVYEALSDTAAKSQAPVREQLDREDVDYQSFYATNAIRVSGGDSDLVTQLAASSSVEGIYPTREYEPPDPEPEDDPVMSPLAVEWGVSDINADDVWSEFGVRGEGIVVGSIDTGVQFDHPALVNQYRGNNGDGTFSHDYHWFDAAGTSPEAPADHNGHGSHVTGTMAGDDGGGNQIGVAPGATWIAANGCCPTDAALVASGEWMLAPTDLEGENPEPTMRPHVINNSWGTQTPSNDPFMEDISEAWAAAGQFAVFANGNSGPSCESSGSPGSRIINYSVGNYTSSHDIAGSSGRGAGQDGEIKPNISAPGTAIRSSVPGNDYALISGTSMASPHVAGAVALAWSAAPGLLGDVDGTRALLDGSAIDSQDLQCGGTADDNNVFGEGRLDAQALLQSAPVGDAGTLEGTVNDAGTGEPLEGATVEVTGELERNLVTDEDGEFTALLTEGDYSLEVELFGYEAETTEVTITAEEVTSVEVALDAAPTATVSGTVHDGSGHDWPLYAAIGVQGAPVSSYTDPATGEYTIEVPTGGDYTLEVQPHYPGYETVTEQVSLSGDTTLDVAVPVDAHSCTAPGYGFQVDGATESFDGEEAPEGWQVVDHLGNGQVWRFDNPSGRDNMTGGEGGHAVMDSDFYGSGNAQDTSLVSPSVDMSALDSPVVGFRQDLNYLAGEHADVDISLDGGDSWQNVVSWQEDLRGPREEVLALPAAAGEPDVRVRFHMHEADWDWWWQVDDVFLGNRACVPTDDGGIVVGTVTGAETGEGIVGASVTSVEDPAVSAATVATPEDDALADGFYWLFSHLLGEQDLTVEARNYESQTGTVTVTADDATRQDFVMGSGFLEVEPEAIQTEVVLGDGSSGTVTVTNSGTGAADVQLEEVAGDVEMLRADGSSSPASDALQERGAPLQRIEDAQVSFAQAGESDGEAAVAARGPADEPWTDLADYPQPVMDARAVTLDGSWYSIGGTEGSASTSDVYRYDEAAMAWEQVAGLPSARNAVTAGVVTGQIVVSGGWVSSGPTGETLVYDAAADSWTAVAENPAAVAAAGQAVYDGRLYSVGGCTTSACTPMSDTVTAYDPASDSWQQLADYPQPVAFASCAGLADGVFCTGGNDGSAATAATYVYDPDSDTWSEVAEAPVDTWASQYAAANGTLVVNGGVQGGAITNATLAYDPAEDAWNELPNSATAVYRGAATCGLAKVGGSIGQFNAVPDSEYLPGLDECGAAATDVEWLSLDQTEFRVEPGDSVTVEVSTDGAVAQPGTYTAGVRVRGNTPQSLDPVAVTMTVTPPASWGKLAGTVQGRACDDTTTPVAGATVDVTPAKGGHPGWTFATDSDGGYAYWLNAMTAKKVQLIAAKDGYRPRVDEGHVRRGKTETVDFLLPEVGC